MANERTRLEADAQAMQEKLDQLNATIATLPKEEKRIFIQAGDYLLGKNYRGNTRVLLVTKALPNTAKLTVLNSDPRRGTVELKDNYTVAEKICIGFVDFTLEKVITKEQALALLA